MADDGGIGNHRNTCPAMPAQLYAAFSAVLCGLTSVPASRLHGLVSGEKDVRESSVLQLNYEHHKAAQSSCAQLQ